MLCCTVVYCDVILFFVAHKCYIVYYALFYHLTWDTLLVFSITNTVCCMLVYAVCSCMYVCACRTAADRELLCLVWLGWVRVGLGFRGVVV